MVVNCEHVWQEVSNYLEGEVDPELRAAMQEHFKGCKHCTAVLDGTRNIIQLYGDERLLEVPVGFSRRLKRRLAQESSSGFRRARALWMLAVAASALLVGGLTLGNSAVFPKPEVRSPLAQSPHGIPPDLLVTVSSDSRVFHIPGCKYLHKHDDEKPIVMTAAQAMREGYVPCVRCLRAYLTAGVECPRPNPPFRWAYRGKRPSGQPGL
jgi:hypothetical protein